MKLPKAYNPAEYEANIYALWEKSGAFQPVDRGGEGRFSMVLPPPNANGDLHIGHALTVAIEDSLVRYNRLQGRAALFVPGADHAGFETWVVYEKKLQEAGKSRFDFSREELYRQVWDFVEQNRHNFEAQLRALGTSCDWSRFTFTLDERVVNQAYQTFQKMSKDGLIYRGARIVNYCTFHGTSFSDIEVVHEQENTKLWHIAYPMADGGGEVVIATTRPETKLGQSALMVNPKDERYKHLIGKLVNQPLVPDKPIPIVGDEHVEMDFGTGVVTVTPGHDPNDFEVAQRHKLPIIELITTEGKMSANVPERFRNMMVAEARAAVEQSLKEAGLLRKVEDYTHSVGKCYKCGTAIEPLVREQWFVSMRPLADKAIEALNSGKIRFYPASKKTQTIRYLQEVRDWNISRQIAWGIPIPAFQNESDETDWIFDTRVTQETITVDGKIYRRDPDVFDTWFSSGQWPFVTLDYPDGDDYKKFYPLDLMETGGEILYQWVARMIMLGLYTTGEVPFKNVYIHGYVLAEDGAKMSKSLGNVINPMEAIAEYGSDALRMGLLTGRRPGVNQGYHPAKIKAGRNFANKLWNIARYVEAKIGEEHINRDGAQPQSSADHWILNKSSICSSDAAKAMEAYRISDAYEHVYRFVWHDLADWYIEASKVQPNNPLLAYVLEDVLKICHPFAPFLTETIWQTLAWEENTQLATQVWPKAAKFDSALVAEFESLRQIVSDIRWLKAISGTKLERLHYSDAKMGKHAELIAKLAGLKEVSQTPQGYSGGLPLSAEHSDWRLDIDPAAVLQKLETKLAEHQKTIGSLQGRLKNQEYISKAPQELVEETKSLLAEAQTELGHLQNVLGALKG